MTRSKAIYPAGASSATGERMSKANHQKIPLAALRRDSVRRAAFAAIEEALGGPEKYKEAVEAFFDDREFQEREHPRSSKRWAKDAASDHVFGLNQHKCSAWCREVQHIPVGSRSLSCPHPIGKCALHGFKGDKAAECALVA